MINNFAKLLVANPIVRYYRDLINTVRKNEINPSARILPESEISRSEIERYASIGRLCEIVNSQIGRYTYVSKGTVIANSSVGPFCSIARDVRLGPGNHPTQHISTHPIFYSTAGQCATTWGAESEVVENVRTVVEADVWIGIGAIILDGVKIGTGSVIAANSVVTCDVEPYTVVAGTPARPIRKRFNPEQIAGLLASRWWEMSDEWIQMNRKLFLRSPDSLLSHPDMLQRGSLRR